MEMTLNIIKISTIDEIENAWTNDDYIALLELFGFEGADGSPREELLELLNMAINDKEPNESANILLTYKLSESLNEGQIDQISNDMSNDRIAEEYPDISIHYDLFNINQFLFKAYNGKFPSTKASKIEVEYRNEHNEITTISAEDFLRAVLPILTDRSLIKRLFEEELSSTEPLKDSVHIIWDIISSDKGTQYLYTSDYWFNSEDLTSNTATFIKETE